MKRAMKSSSAILDRSLENEACMREIAGGTNETHEEIIAFAEKRSSVFKGKWLVKLFL
jgi:hypothetical protein